MAVGLIQNPLVTSWSRNPIVFGVHTDSPLETVGLAIEVKVLFKRINDAVYTTILNLILTVDIDGNIEIDLRRVLDSYLTYQLPDLSNITESSDQTGLFQFDYRELPFDSNDPNGGWTTDQPRTYAVIKGGIPNEQWSANPTANYFDNSSYLYKEYMTWKKPGTLVRPEEQHFLTYFHSTTQATQSVVNFILYYSNGTTDIHVQLQFSNEFKQYALYIIPVGMNVNGLNLVNSNKDLISYTVQPYDGNQPLTNAPFQYIVDYRPLSSSALLHYFNSKGGMDAVRIEGDVERVINRATVIGSNTKKYNPLSSAIKSYSFHASVEEQITYKANVGYIEDPQEQDNLRELLLSKEVYELKFNRWLPIILLTEELSLGLESTELFEFPIEYKYAFSNDNYAPNWINVNA